MTDSIRCLIADISQGLLADIIKRVTEINLNAEVIGCVKDIENISPTAIKYNANVVIIGNESFQVPRIYDELLTVLPNLVVLGILDDGRRLSLYVDDAGPDELTELIRVVTKARSSDLKNEPDSIAHKT